MISTELKEKIRKVPQNSGVYIMKNRGNEIIYIGKAKNLKNRVSSYFHKKTNEIKTETLVQNIFSIETIVTDNEIEAFLLESNLIKKYKPRYNIELKDNNKYPYLKITNEKYPRIVKTRIKKDDSAMYFGPYTNVKYLNRTIKTITDLFPIRRCSRKPGMKYQGAPCMNYYLKKCICPLMDEIDEKGYAELVDQAVLFLKGQSTQLLTHVKKEMLSSAQDRRFEQAIQLRERYKALQNLLEDQKINTLKAENEDIFGIAAVNDTYNVTVLIKRDGKIIGKRDFTIMNSMGEKEVLEQFLDHFYYEENSDPPDKIVLPFEPEGMTTLKSYLKDKYGRNISIIVPQKGMKKRLMELARKNAFLRIKEDMYQYDPAKAVVVLKTVLRLDTDPKCIEAFDVATTLGDFSVASMVRFTDGVPSKRNYRKYRIKYTSGQNDVEMIKEAVARRYQRLLNEKKPMPDLVLVDGGVTQVNGALKVLDALDLAEIPVIGLAKKHEHIYAPWKKEQVVLEKSNEALRLLMSIRNEAHRFANTYHVNIRDREILSSKLKTIPGIGDSLTNAILTSFLYPGNEISLDSLVRIKGLGLTKAREVYKLLQESNTR